METPFFLDLTSLFQSISFIHFRLLQFVEAVKNISPAKKDKKLIRHKVAGDPELLQNDRVVIASSIFLQVHWKNELFKPEDTIKDGEFELENSKV